MLQADVIHVADIEKVRGAQIGRQVLLLNFEANHLRVLVAARYVVHRHGQALALRMRACDGGKQVGRESGNAALAWQVAADKSDSLSCALNELMLERNKPIKEDVRAWAARIADAATGLLEPLRLLEADQSLGKAVLADVAEGKPSLPLAIALKRLPPLREEMGVLLKGLPEDEMRARTRTFAGRLSRTGALGAARRIAEKERDAALAALQRVPPSPTRELLAQVARALLSRSN